MARTFTHPSGNGYIQRLGFREALWASAFGPLYCLFHGAFYAAVKFFLTDAVWLFICLYVATTRDTIEGPLILYALGRVLIGFMILDDIAASYQRRGWWRIQW